MRSELGVILGGTRLAWLLQEVGQCKEYLDTIVYFDVVELFEFLMSRHWMMFVKPVQRVALHNEICGENLVEHY